MGDYLRTKKTYQAYKKYKAKGGLSGGCALCNEKNIVKNFKYWKILQNRFPHDYLAQISHIIIPKRHAIYQKLNKEEKAEFEKIKLGHIEQEYEIMLEATNRRKSIPEHHHIHLMILRRRV